MQQQIDDLSALIVANEVLREQHLRSAHDLTSRGQSTMKVRRALGQVEETLEANQNYCRRASTNGEIILSSNEAFKIMYLVFAVFRAHMLWIVAMQGSSK